MPRSVVVAAVISHDICSIMLLHPLLVYGSVYVYQVYSFSFINKHGCLRHPCLLLTNQAKCDTITHATVTYTPWDISKVCLKKLRGLPPPKDPCCGGLSSPCTPYSFPS